MRAKPEEIVSVLREEIQNYDTQQGRVGAHVKDDLLLVVETAQGRPELLQLLRLQRAHTGQHAPGAAPPGQLQPVKRLHNLRQQGHAALLRQEAVKMRQWAALLQPGQPGQYPPLFSFLAEVGEQA